ncbi:MAG: rhodanese-like domain-containing protein [Caldilinea sp.]|nr:rhodanese-like domain-containing protein [Caldilinea sp.]MCB0066389.1 rhodanese-like domain-containing protein [Caldilineaceae bacterium]MCB0135301.1 rhodanese-like domain-containing protein [Caldilineaceae bacterium]MCB0148553.1 rhodanese-like domain-containing protein [Caldilineaceae bacterium]MCB9115911.1 rhodanese-like domain-containing protein [Caldilineaceae bacterium]
MNKVSMRHLASLMLVLLVLVLAGCNAAPPAAAPSALFDAAQNSDGFADISVAQLANALENKNFTLVNVHIPYAGELPETDLFIPFNEIDSHEGELPDKDSPIVVYCRSGAMSTQAAATLVAAGYTQVYELDGGMVAWTEAGHELLSGRK